MISSSAHASINCSAHRPERADLVGNVAETTGKWLVVVASSILYL